MPGVISNYQYLIEIHYFIILDYKFNVELSNILGPSCTHQTAVLVLILVFVNLVIESMLSRILNVCQNTSSHPKNDIQYKYLVFEKYPDTWFFLL